MSSSAYQYNRMGWRSKYDIFPSKSTYDSLRHTYTNGTSAYTNYSSLSRNTYNQSAYNTIRKSSFDVTTRRANEIAIKKVYGVDKSRDAVRSKSYALSHTRRKSYAGLLHTTSYDTSYDTSDRGRTHEAIRRKSEITHGKSRTFDTVDNKSNVTTASYRNGITGSIHTSLKSTVTMDTSLKSTVTMDTSLKSTVTMDTVCTDTTESKYNGTVDVRKSNFKNSETSDDKINDVMSNKTNCRPEKMSSGHVELTNGVVVHKKLPEIKSYEMHEKLDNNTTKASIERKWSTMKGSKDYSAHARNDIAHAHRKLPEPPSNKIQRDRSKIFSTSESKCNGAPPVPAILSNVSVENKCNVTIETGYNGMKSYGPLGSKHDVSTDVSKCNGVMENDVSKFNGVRENDVSKFNGVRESDVSKCNGFIENAVSKCNGFTENDVSKGNSLSESDVSKRNASIENNVIKCNASIENDVSKCNGSIENDVSKCNGSIENDVSKCNGSIENEKKNYWKSKYNSDIRYKQHSSANERQCNDISEMKTNDTTESRNNVAMETKCKVAMEGNISGNIDIDIGNLEKQCNGIAEGRINVVLETKINLVVESECNGTAAIHWNGIPENIGNITAVVGRCKDSKIEYIYNGIKESKNNGIKESKNNCTPGSKIDNIMENNGNIAMETNANVRMESKSNIAMETKSYIAMETKSNVAMETKQNLAIESQNNITVDTKSNIAAETKNMFTMDAINNDLMGTKNNVAMETRTNVGMESKSNIAMETKSYVPMETKNNDNMENKSKVAVETESNDLENKNSVTMETSSTATMENKSNIVMETKNNVTIETRSTATMDTKSSVAMESQNNVATENKNNVATAHKSNVAVESNGNAVMATKSNVSMETKCNGTTEHYSSIFSKGTKEYKRNGVVEGKKFSTFKRNGVVEGKKCNTVYRNQYNRKQGRPLYAERITDFEHNALCLWLALQRLHQGFLKVFHMYFPTKPGLLHKALTSHRVRLFQLQQRGLIEQSDWDLLFPKDGFYTNSSAFDLVLISLLLRTVCEYREPKEGWWKVAAGIDSNDKIHFSKIFSVFTELSNCNFSINDATFELLRKRLDKYMTMLGPLTSASDVSDDADGNYSDEFIQFSAAKAKLKTLEKKMLRVETFLKAVWWQVPCYTHTHINRTIKLGDAIDARLKVTEVNTDDVNHTSVFALVGPSGIGKTETARFWAYHFCQKFDGNVIWVNSENFSNIDTAFVKLAKRLGLSLQDKFGKPVIVDGLHYHIYDYFSNRKSLFIFDDVKDDAMLQQIIPQTKTLYPIILVTSQCKTLRGNVVSHELEIFADDDAAQLIEQIADHCDVRDMQKLSVKMNHLPFALELASYIISKRGISIMEFIRLFERMTKGVSYERDGKSLLGALVRMFIDGCAYEKNKNCIEDLLCLMSLMHGNKIDLELLLQWKDHTKINIKAALKEMTSYALIKMTNYRDMSSNKCGFTMHSTIQHAIKKSKLDEVGDQTTFHLNGFLEMYHLRKVLDLIDHYRQYENKLCPSYGQLWAHHIINILHNYKSCNGVMFKLEMFKHDIAIFNIQNRHYQSALHILEIFRHFELSLKVDNEDLLLDTEREYGNCFLMQGNFDAALSVFLKIHAKERQERTRTENVQEPTLMTRFHIGICLQYLAISERQTTSEAESDILKPRGTGAVFKKEDEKISAALSVFQDVYNKANKTLHGRHPLVVTAFHHIGICKYYQGDLSTALKIFLKVSEIVLDLDCERQPNNLLMEDQFRRVDERGGEHLSSDLAAFEELYARQKDLLGDTHPIALESKSQIAKCLQEVGSFLPALKHFSEIYVELKNLYGEEHPRSLACREDIGSCLRRTKEFSAAYEIYNDVSKKRHTLLGENHPHTLDAQYETGTCLYYLNEFEAATLILRRVFERKKKVLGELHTSTLLTKQTYAICLRDSGDTSTANKILQEVYDKYKVVYGENHPTTLSSRQQIGICHLRQLRFSIAYDVLKEVYDKYHALFGEENLRTLTSEYYVSLCLMKLGKFMDALILLRNICDNLDKLIGLDEPIYLDSAHHLGICLQAQGYLWTAINVFQEVYNLRKHQNDRASTMCSSHRLAMCCLDIGNHFAARYAFTELYESLSKK